MASNNFTAQDLTSCIETFDKRFSVSELATQFSTFEKSTLAPDEICTMGQPLRK
jgi:hypothetical protein